MPSYEELTDDLFGENKSSFRRIDALEQLRTSNHPMALDAILQVANDKDRNVRRKVASALASFRDPRCIDALGQLVDDEDERVRENAIRSLAETGDPNAEEFITKGLSDSNWLVQRASRDALERLKTRIAEEQENATDSEQSLAEIEEIPDVSKVLDQPQEATTTGEESTVILESAPPKGEESPDISDVSEILEESPPKETRAWCAIHPENEAIGICERCGNFICPECKRMVDEKLYCSACFESVSPKAGYTPWEDRHKLGFFTALWRTIKQVLFSPSEFYRNMPVSGGIGEPLIFAIIFAIIGGLVSAFWQFVLQISIGTGIGAIWGKGPAPLVTLIPTIGTSLASVICAPIAGIIGVFISSGILHLCVMIVRARKYPFEATFRVVCYATATQVVTIIIPLLGGYITGIWALVVEIIGIKEAHETTVGKAVLAVLLPLIFFCGLFIIMVPIIMVILFAIGASS